MEDQDSKDTDDMTRKMILKIILQTLRDLILSEQRMKSGRNVLSNDVPAGEMTPERDSQSSGSEMTASQILQSLQVSPAANIPSHASSKSGDREKITFTCH